MSDQRGGAQDILFSQIIPHCDLKTLFTYFMSRLRTVSGF